MNGPYHFGMAQGLLEAAREDAHLSDGAADRAVAMAGVHATLALVAAHIDTRGNCYTSNDEGWSAVLK